MSAPLILVVEDNPITRKMVRVTLETEGFGVAEAPDGATALRVVECESPALVLQDYVLPDMTGNELLLRIRRHHDATVLPVILVTGLASRVDELADQGGFTAVLAKPVEPGRLIEAVRAGLTTSEVESRETNLPPRRVLVVDDEPGNRKLAATRLTLAGYRPLTAASGEEALREAKRHPPDVILGDVLMPGLDGFQLCLAARRDAALAAIPIVLISSAYTDDGDRNLALLVGASALVPRTPDLAPAIAAIEAVFSSGARVPALTTVSLDQPYVESLRRQVDRQMARNQELARRAGIQAAALSMVGGLARALAKPLEISDVIGDVLVHCLDAAGLSTGLLYLCGTDGVPHLHCMAGVPEVLRARAEAGFGQAALLASAGCADPIAFHVTEGEPEERAFLAGLQRRSALVIPFVVAGTHYGTLVLASDEHDLTDVAWETFAQVLAAQFGQAVALGRSLTQVAESDALLRNAVDASPNGMVMADACGRIVMANRQIETMFGYGPGELVGQDIEALIPARHRAGHAGQRGSFVDDPHTRLMGVGRELSAVRRNGEEFPVEIGLAPVTRGHETFTIASVIDITERKKAAAALAETGERLQTLLDHANDGVAVLTPAGVIREVNRRMVEIAGRPADELTGHYISEFVPPAAVEVRLAEFTAAVTAGTGVVHDVAILRGDGSSAAVDFSLSSVQVGPERLVLTIGRDVTQQRLVERQLRQAQKMEAVGRLAGGVAHDFNNVLTAIFGYLDVVMGDLPEDSPSRADLSEALKAAGRAASLTRQLLAFSRQQVLQPTVLNINDVVANLEKMLRRVIGEDIALHTVLAPDVDNTVADAGQLEQVLMNLVVNARDSMPDGGRLTIETTNEHLSEAYADEHQSVVPGSYVRLAVSDTGTGMSPETMARAFEPFFTTKEKGKGTGLGLSTVYGIVKQSGGYVWIYSEPGRGTTFKIYLPRAEAQAPATPRGSVPRPTENKRGTETVLLAEDDEFLRPLVRGLLAREGYVVLDAPNADAAIACAGAHSGPIDLLVTDVVMPGGSGRDLARRLAESRPDTKVLYVSGYTDDAIVLHGMLEAGLEYLQKPFTPDVLGKKVRQVLDGSP